MGNEQSLSSSTEINHKAIEVTDFYTHHSASVNFGNVNNLSVFIGEEILDGSIWIKQTPLEKSSKNLMVYRHPCILKYFSSWEKGSKFHLAVEDVKPLSLVLSTLNNLQICIGLHSILKALCFLHNIAEVSHNNVCLASIYVSKDGHWKLGGMEYLCKFKEMTSDYMGKTKKYRYNKGIDPNELKHFGEKKLKRNDFVDLYGFSVLVLEVLKKNNDDIPFLGEFLELCRKDLQNSNVDLRPKFNSLLDHDFFNHDFIKIHCFLTELPLKSDVEKNEFFTSLIGKLRNFDESIIARQLTNLLLSRMVLLNKTAQTNVIPFLLCPKEDTEDENLGLFTTDTFKKYVIPKLLEIFCVRDAQIRLLLLEHLNHYINCFQVQELQSNILPELLVGVKDTNDQLVAITLRALADLVPILGSETVIGGKRAKLFNDGRPIQHLTRKQRKSLKRNDLNTPSSICIEKDLVENKDILQDLPERPSPDGEEGETSTEDLEEEDNNWEDWDLNEAQREITKENLETSINTEMSSMSLDVNRKNSKKDLPDILELDIKNQKNKTDLDDIDFFQDMEPVIEVSKFNVEAKDVDVRKFGVANEDKEEGWGDDDW